MTVRSVEVGYGVHGRRRVERPLVQPGEAWRLNAVEVVALDHQRDHVARVLAEVFVDAEAGKAAALGPGEHVAEERRALRIVEAVGILRGAQRRRNLSDQRGVARR